MRDLHKVLPLQNTFAVRLAQCSSRVGILIQISLSLLYVSFFFSSSCSSSFILLLKEDLYLVFLDTR